MAVEGVDFSSARPSGSALKAAGKHFVVRYLSPNSQSNPGKRLTTTEINDYRGAGLDIAVVWETTTTRATQGRAAGETDAHASQTQLVALGMPTDLPVYFAIDSNVAGSDCAAYFQGVASVIGKRRTGAYGGYNQIKYMLDNGLVTYGWQTYAWSTPPHSSTVRWDPRAQLQQYRNGVTVGGGDVDLDRAMVSDFGQWAATDNTHPSVPVEVDMPLTQADADLVADTLLKRGLGADGNPTVAVALDRAAQAFTIDALMQQKLGNSGPVAGVAWQSTYQMVTAIQAALDPTTLAGIVAQAIELAGVDVPEATLQAALVGALKELAAAAPTTAS